ncbi:MAG: hypothetical protein J07HQW2_03561 [Haloquadratum walsbyi J07HQW2]|uniref:Uncharacterized protein n=1 Tax=Haloquadratum walsbyi J07HQW2 TaxID=1238425 RepID=U1NIN3_9EURY|nr:MAG: hypothetical protein J07HQW2_03561 [Haloquadratum walsbyi J07HQW2]
MLELHRATILTHSQREEMLDQHGHGTGEVPAKANSTLDRSQTGLCLRARETSSHVATSPITTPGKYGMTRVKSPTTATSKTS